MAFSARLELRQSQSLVMTPQLQQAIKLLQLSNMELDAFVSAELERNPLLERDDTPGPIAGANGSSEPAGLNGADAAVMDRGESRGEALTLFEAADGAPANPFDGHDAEPDAVFPEARDASGGSGDDLGSWAGMRDRSGSFNGDDGFDLEDFATRSGNLHDHLSEQLPLVISAPAERLIAQNLIDMVDEAGYLRGDLAQLADQLGCPLALVEAILAKLQTLEPTGCFARSLAECLALQLKELGRYDPLIAKVLDNLTLLAEHRFDQLRRICGIDQEDLADIIGDIKSLNPKPGLAFGSQPIQPVVPDVLVRARADGSYRVELNVETLPRVLVNQSYYSVIARGVRNDKDKTYVSECLQTANWLIKSLDQRARTILKVSEEIVRQQDAFFAHGVQHMRPLNLKTVADIVKLHESTVSRVTSNKYMATNRGIFELKYFFTSAIASADDGEAHSSESVRHRIKQLIDAEPANDVLSDDKLVEKLRAEGVDIARRTVAKYREALRIPSSVQRRRQKLLALKGQSAR